MAKPARKVTARSDAHGAFLPVANPRVKRGTRITVRNVKQDGGTLTNVPGYVSKIVGGVATIDTWGVTRPLILPVVRLRTMVGVA